MNFYKKTKLETYGTRKDVKARFQVILLFSLLIITVVLLSIGGSIIINKEVPSIVSSISDFALGTDSESSSSSSSSGSGSGSSGSSSGSSGSQKTLVLEGPLADIETLSDSPFVQDLPKSGVVHLKVGSDSYTVTKGSIVSGAPSDPDILASIPEEYHPRESSDLCEILEAANANKVLHVELYKSKAALSWQYRSLYKYKDCLGL